MSTYLQHYPSDAGGRVAKVMKPNPAAAAAATTHRAAAKTPSDFLMSVLSDYWGSRLTPAQQAAQTNKGISTQIGLEEAAARRATQSLQTDAANNARRAQGYAQAVAAQTAGVGTPYYDDYERAANNIKALGTGLTGAVLDTQQAEAQKTADAISQASGGLINTPGTSYDLPGLRSSALASGVVAPAADLYGEAANQAAGARAREGAYAGNVENIVQNYAAMGTQAKKDLVNKLADIEATRPDLYQKAVESAQAGGRQDIATMISGLALANTQTETTAQIANAKAQTKIDQQAAALKTAADKNKALTDAAKARATGATATAKVTGYQPDRKTLASGYYKPAGANGVPQPYDINKYKIKTNPDGTQVLIPLPAPASASGAASTDKSQSTILETNRQLPTASNTLGYGKVLNSFDVKYQHAKPIYGPTMPVATAITQLRAKYPKALRNDDRVTAAIKDALRALGYKV